MAGLASWLVRRTVPRARRRSMAAVEVRDFCFCQQQVALVLRAKNFLALPLGVHLRCRALSCQADLEYGDKTFWDARYAASSSTLFDWYQDYEALAELLLVRAPHMRSSLLCCVLTARSCRATAAVAAVQPHFTPRLRQLTAARGALRCRL